MNKSELAKVKRLENRIHDLRTSLYVISAWIGVDIDTAEELMYRIKKFCVEKAENDKSLEAKEQLRELKAIAAGKEKVEK